VKRFLIAACTIAVATSLVATPSMAVTRAVVPVVDGDPGVIAIPSDELSQNAEALARRLRDKMPFISKSPSLVGNDLVWEADISPMRLTYRKGVSLLDRVGASVFVSRAGVDLRKPISGDKSKATLFKKDLPTRLVTKAGPQEFRLALPSKIADELRKIPASSLASRVRVVVRDEKDIDAANPGYDRTQLTSSAIPSGLATYLAGRRSAVEPSGWRSATPKVSLWRSIPMKRTPPPNTPGTIVYYNGSPFNIELAWSDVQCNSFLYYPTQVQEAVSSNDSVETENIAQIQGFYTYQSNPDEVQAAAKQPSQWLVPSAEDSIQEGALIAGLSQSFSQGLSLAVISFSVGLVLKGVGALVTKIKTKKDECTNAGSAINVAWTNVSVGANQTTGNVSYWVPTFNRTGNMVGVPPTSLPVVAPGSPLTGYNATSQNGLAASPAVLAKELGLGGTVTLATLNSDQQVPTPQGGTYNGFWCNFTNQQIGNPNSQTTTSVLGSTSLSGGTTASWGPCNATSVPQQDAIDMTGNNDSYVVMENEGFTFLIGYSTTAYNTAGPAPAVSQPTTAASSTACIATATPCTFYTPPAGSTPASFGCTPGTWNMLTPWNTASTTMSLSNPPSAYSASSQLTMQLAFRGVSPTGTVGTYFAPVSTGGNVITSFSPSAIASWQLTAADIAAIQKTLGGPGSYVSEWACVMTAATTIPTGIPASATSMNLGWYGVPVVATLPNPAGGPLAPPA